MIRDYIMNGAGEFLPEDSNLYKKYFNPECSIRPVFCGSGAFLYDKLFDNDNNPLMGLAVLTAADCRARALLGNHGEKPVSGLIGLLRNLFSGKDN